MSSRYRFPIMTDEPVDFGAYFIIDLRIGYFFGQVIFAKFY